MEPEPEQRPSEEGLGTEAFSSNLVHHMVLQATAQQEREPSVLRGVWAERERETQTALQTSSLLSFCPLFCSLARWLARSLADPRLLARSLTLRCAGTCKYPGAEVQFVGYQYSGASGPLPGIPYSTLADDEGNVRASLPLPPPPCHTRTHPTTPPSTPPHPPHPPHPPTTLF